MASKKRSPGMRLQRGASVLSAAEAVDTRLVKDRLTSFERVHRSYVNAQRKLDAAEAELRRAQGRLEEHRAVQGEALDGLAGALVADGQPLTNPFEAFGAPSRGGFERLGYGEEAEAVHELVTAVLRSKAPSKIVVQAAQAAEKAATSLERTLGPIAKLQDRIFNARKFRDTVGHDWDAALSALKRGARAAADEGAPTLYARLFPPVVRAAPKGKGAEETPATGTPPPAETGTTTPVATGTTTPPATGATTPAATAA